MEKIIYRFAVVMITFIVLSSCSKDEPIEKKEFPEFIELVSNAEIKGGGYLTPYGISIVDYIASIRFVESNTGVTIHITDENSKLCVELFKDAIQKEVPLKIFTVGNSREVARVHQASKETIDYYRELRVPVSQSRWGEEFPDENNIIPVTDFDMLQFFLDDVSTHINWNFTGDGCFARAHYVAALAAGYGFTCYKLFYYPVNEGDQIGLENYDYNCWATWDWHVVPIVFDETQYGLIPYVIDMSISNEPIHWGDYGNLIGGVPQYVKQGNVYIYNPRINWTIYDDNLSHTNCVLNFYSNYEGCMPYRHDCNF